MDKYSTIINAALACARVDHYLRVTRDQIAFLANVPPSLVTYHLGDMEQIRERIMEQAVREGDLRVVLQGIAQKDATALSAPYETRRKCLNLLAVEAGVHNV